VSVTCHALRPPPSPIMAVSRPTWHVVPSCRAGSLAAAEGAAGPLHGTACSRALAEPEMSSFHAA